jgi:NAD(P)-dependent dehydrogenase (short-subunit alcohol dehydrogenase family)/acyl carrier protein
LAVVAEKTGYPAEMLDLAMALDADLGIDSIKRVEILSALQEKLPHAPQVKPEHLGTLHTLRDVAAFLSGTVTIGSNGQAMPEPSAPLTERLPKIQAAVPSDSALFTLMSESEGRTPPPDSRDSEVPRLPATETIERSILQAVDLDLRQVRPRISLPAQGEFWLVAADEPLTTALVGQLTKLGFAVNVYPWDGLAATKLSGTLCGLVLLTPATIPADLPLNRLALRWLQHAGPQLRQTSRRASAALIASIARLDGTFGLANLSPTADPTSGGLAGLMKTVRHEWPELTVKAIDLAPALADTPDSAAATLAEELLTTGPTEVGLAPTHRSTLELARTVRRTNSHTITFGPQDVILVSGGARGVTAEAAVALAEAFRPTLILTGRTSAPTGPEPAWLAGLSDEAALKKAIADYLQDDATPKTVGEFYARVMAQREIRRTLARIEKAGARGAYFAVNAAARKAVADLLQQVRAKFGPITAVVHGAGVLADRKIEHLTSEQFDHVYATKVDGIRTLLDLLSEEELKAVVLFSSTTARFGRIGQAAYAAANEVLNKIAQVEARKRPAARVVAINWGPWDGGMVTPALRKVFEAEGIGLIPLADGGAFVVQELNAVGRAVEVIALGNKWRTGGSGTAGLASLTPPPGIKAAGTSSAPPAVPPAAELTVAFERTVDVSSHPVLRSHVLDGRAVLPMAVHLEWLAHAALHGNPGLVFHGINDLRITVGVMVEDGASSHLRLMAGKAVKRDNLFHVPVELRGRRRDGRDVIHSRAEVILTAALPKPPTAETLPVIEPYPHPHEELYKYFLFHGPDLHGIESAEGLTEVAFVGTAYPAPPPAEWFLNPLRSSWVADPLVLDASFQMMILWSYAQHGSGSLPCFAGRYRQYRRNFPAGPTRVVIRVTRDNGTFARADIDYLDADGIVVAQLQDYECVIDPGLNQAFRRNQLGPMVRQ